MNLNLTFMGQTVSSIFRCKNKTYHLDRILSTAKFPESQMVQRCKSSKGVRCLKLITGTVNASFYNQVLEECLEPVSQNYFKGAGNCVF